MSGQSADGGLLQAIAYASWPPLLIAEIIQIPSALLYLAEVLFIVFYWRQFNSSFYILFLVRASCELLLCTNTYFFMRFGQMGLFTELFLQMPRLLIAVFVFGMYYLFHSINLATVFMLLNRLTFRSKFWQFGLPLAIGLVFIVPLPVTLHILSYRVFIHVQLPTNKTFTIDQQERIEGIQTSDQLIMLISSFIFTFLCLAINIGIILRYQRAKKLLRSNGMMGVAQQQPQQDDTLERRLTIYAVVSFLGQFIFVAYKVLLYWAVRAGNQLVFLAVFNQFSLMNDFSTIVVPSWLFLWASDPMRKMVNKLFAHIFCCHTSTTENPYPATVEISAGSSGGKYNNDRRFIVATGAQIAPAASICRY